MLLYHWGPKKHDVLQSLNATSLKIQHFAAKMIKSANKYDSVTALLFSLKWLPVRLRIIYKIIVLVFKALDNLAPLNWSGLVLDP